ncbi:MAG: hypothetical protein HQK87_01295 [Nitrospinae bacterium]|nr:hypothetical protein [Nitrospinota bacterium]
MKSIPGEPEKVTRRYVEAIQTGDYHTLFRLNHVTARRLKYFDMSELPEDREEAVRYQAAQQAEYEATPPDFTPGVRWAERHYFPPTARVTVGKAVSPAAAPNDPVNADYEKANSVTVPVTVDYPDPGQAPLYQGKPMASAAFDCMLIKLRVGKNVAVYSHDDQWYVNGVILDPATVRFAD